MIRASFRLFSALILSLPLGLGVIPACSEGSAPPVPEVDEARFFESLAAAICKRREECFCSGADGSAFSQAACNSADFRASIQNAFKPPSLTLKYDGSCAVLFLDEFEHTPGCSIELASLSKNFRCTVCSVFSGDNSLDAGCALSGMVSDDCQPGLFCSSGSQRCVNSCPASVGEPCQGFGCRDGSFCDCGDPPGSSGTCTCKPRPRSGEPCSGGCASDSFCEPTPQSPPENFVPVCQPRRADGAGCNDYEQCLSGFCPDGVCRPETKLGESCQGGLCSGGFSCQDGICTGNNSVICYSP